MLDLLSRLGLSVCLAYCSQRGIGRVRITRRWVVDVPLVVMIVILSLFCGLRTNFNDTRVYIDSFLEAQSVGSLFEHKINLLNNPLFHLFQSIFRHHISDNYHLYLVVIAFFSVCSFVRFIKAHSVSFPFSIILFFAIGLYISNFAAMKQCIAMAILTYAISALLKRRYLRFYALVFLAMLFHSYAIMLIVLPLFMNKPWTLTTYVSIAAIAFVLFTFETTITSFLEYAEDLGKNISEDIVFDTDSINIFRLAVFGVPPVLSFLFRKRLSNSSTEYNLAMNMSILSFLVMCLGLISAGNLFGRSAIYFEIGTIVVLPYIIKHVFERRSAKMVIGIASCCYFAFFLYDMQSFVSSFNKISFMEFLLTL